MKLGLFIVLTAAADYAAMFFYSAGHPLALIAAGDPLTVILLTGGAFVLASFLAGWLTQDYSWVDRFWSIAPVIYAWFLALRGRPDSRLFLCAILVTLWGARLTYNFARKGGYTGVEDYRWAEIRKIINNKLLWQLFNLFFISFYQHLLIVLFTLPVYILYRNKGNPLNSLDLLLSILFIAFLALETAADQQQWNYQQKKKAVSGKNKSEDIKRGFLAEGLFRYSRHPNYFAEICIWWVVYLFSVSVTGSLVNWSCAGAVLLTLLFKGSSVLTELISARKYPRYAVYKQQTSKIFPWFVRNPESRLIKEKSAR
jgi:steroid 5-alpha reductase family enzyme